MLAFVYIPPGKQPNHVEKKLAEVCELLSVYYDLGHVMRAQSDARPQSMARNLEHAEEQRQQIFKTLDESADFDDFLTLPLESRKAVRWRDPDSKIQPPPVFTIPATLRVVGGTGSLAGPIARARTGWAESPSDAPYDCFDTIPVNRISEIRQAANMSQNALVNWLDAFAGKAHDKRLNQSQIDRIEKGIRSLTPEITKDLAASLRVPIECLQVPMTTRTLGGAVHSPGHNWPLVSADQIDYQEFANAIALLAHDIKDTETRDALTGLRALLHVLLDTFEFFDQTQFYRAALAAALASNPQTIYVPLLKYRFWAEMQKRLPEALALQRLDKFVRVVEDVAADFALKAEPKYVDDDKTATERAFRLADDWAIVDIGYGPPLSGDVGDAELVQMAHKKDLPVMGNVQGSVEKLNLNIGTDALEFTSRPHYLENVTGAYAVYVYGDSMHPAFKPGERLFVNPISPPKPGDDVVVDIELGDERYGTVKELRRRTDKSLVLWQHNPAPGEENEIVLEAKNVKAVHKIVGKMVADI